VTTGRAVAERGSYAPQDLPKLFRERFVARDDSAVALYVIPSGSAWDGQTGQAFHKAVAGDRPGRLGAGGQHQPARDDDHHRLSPGGRAVGGADLPGRGACSCAGCGTRRWP
jgi:hypothetical protein